uniref:Uncharacterized protein n=1 Tax=Vibrio splendidus TaxID=29497 RepID=A0A0H3ZQ22_VIBSP|nr:hypothetical protein [Vibrio splendidus]AKN36009.1 hypothetical protein [Vibrio splendidus]AKN38458.1 hypothetical protein [Vibrio splendidus]AKN39777.1 hypothetical protein [Vibrio splendidus]
MDRGIAGRVILIKHLKLLGGILLIDLLVLGAFTINLFLYSL